jgi:hypothetical protein
MQTFTVSWLTDVLFAAIYATQSAGYAHLTPSATNDQGSQNSGPSGAKPGLTADFCKSCPSRPGQTLWTFRDLVS